MAYYPRVFYENGDGTDGGGSDAVRNATLAAAQNTDQLKELEQAYSDLLEAEQAAAAARAAGNEQLAQSIEEQNKASRAGLTIGEDMLDNLRERIDREKELLENQELTLMVGMKIVNQVKDQVVALDEQRKVLGTTTGLFGQFDQQLANSVATAARFGKGVAEVGATIGSLANGMVSFTQMTEQNQKTLIDGSLALQQFGVNAETSAKANDLLIGSLNRTAEEAIGFQKDLIELGSEIGVSGSKLVSQFGDNAETLARFGDRAEEVFMNLAKTAKATGVEMNELFDLANKFNTFDGAASAVGRLNAQMGTNLDAMTLLTEEDPEKQVLMLRDAFLATGKSLQNMTKFEKMAAAEAMGMDLTVLEKFLGPKEEQTEADKNFEELTKKTQTFTDKISALGKQFLTLFTPLISGLVDVLDFVGEGVSLISEFTQKVAENKTAVYTLGTIMTVLLGPSIASAIKLLVMKSAAFVYDTAVMTYNVVASNLSRYSTMAGTVATAARTAATTAASAATTLFNLVLNSNLVAMVASTAAVAAATVGLFALEAVTYAVEGAVMLFNAALYANPIGLVVLAVVGLIGALYLLYDNMDAVGEFFIGIWDSITEKVQAAIDIMAEAADFLTFGLFDFAGDDEGEDIPALANGTPNFEGGSAIVGEKGPELVNLPRGAEVVPNNKLTNGQTTAAPAAARNDRPTVVKLVLNERELGQAVLDVLDDKMSLFLGMD
tara:strand:- start:6138 stop:8300 length:2163 start_codon:yes stop_codon:yes gene_type:complete